MRAVHLSDLNIAARTLLAVPEAIRADMIKEVLSQAQVADKYRKRTGRSHAQFGNGSLSAACQHRIKSRRPDRCDPNYLECLEIVIQALIGRAGDEIP